MELEKTLLNNKDKYYQTFNLNDLKVRNIKTIEEYNNNIKNSCINFTDDDINILDSSIQMANSKLKKFNTVGFNGLKASQIQWRIGLIHNNIYENGFPHTRNNIIILPKYILENKNKLVEVLIHEKIHIYQKLYPSDILLYLKKNGFHKYRIKDTNDNIRANPDTDNFIYKNLKGEIMKCLYQNNPNTIEDVVFYPINEDKYEHPYEYMAYTLSKIIVKL
jgi:hypothetical protein